MTDVSKQLSREHGAALSSYASIVCIGLVEQAQRQPETRDLANEQALTASSTQMNHTGRPCPGPRARARRQVVLARPTSDQS